MNTRYEDQVGGFQKSTRSTPRKQQQERDVGNKKNTRRQQSEFKRNSVR